MIGPLSLLRNLIRKRPSTDGPEQRPTAAAEVGAGTVIESPRIGPGLLFPDLLPENVWGSNLRGILTRAEWDRLRIPACERAGNVCEVCGRAGYDPVSGRRRRPDCHELWSFEIRGDQFVQRLDRLIALDAGCHRTQHIGLAGIRGETHLVRRRLAEVNGWDARVSQSAIEEAVAIYRRRASFNWDLNLSLLQGQIHVEGFPQLFIPAEERQRLGNSYFGG
ncbi:hypothetical protein [Glycomyces sp. NPDC048151]|uniref:hypothetical protein n=1 Tax=Glycomyces sp. NPDC048151 TaxID=3364002 RepID=UPI003716AE3D